MREKSQQPGGGGDLLAYKQESCERKDRVKRSNSRGGGGDLVANTTPLPPKKKLRVNNKERTKENRQKDNMAI